MVVKRILAFLLLTTSVYAADGRFGSIPASLTMSTGQSVRWNGTAFESYTTGAGGIGGSIADQQIAFGTGTDITGSDFFYWDSTDSILGIGGPNGSGHIKWDDAGTSFYVTAASFPMLLEGGGISIGTDQVVTHPFASTGSIRLQKQFSVNARNNANSADIPILSMSSGDVVSLGDLTNGGLEFDPGNSVEIASGTADLLLQSDGTIKIINFTTNGFLKTGSSDGTLSVDTASYQPLDSDLTSIAALSTTSFGRGFLTQADAAASRSYIGAGTGSGDALTSGTLAQFASTTSAQLRGVLSDESGTGVFLTDNGSAANLTSFPTFNQNTTGSAATLTTARTLWGQSFDGSANVTGSLTSVGDITGGASNMTITAGTGNSRTLTLKSTTSGGTATTFLTGNADQTVTFTSGFTAAGNSTIGANQFTCNNIVLNTGALTFSIPTGALQIGGTPVLVNGGSLGTPSGGTLTNCTFPTLNQNTTGSAAKWTTARNLAGNSVDGSANVAFANNFVVQGTSDSGLSGAQFLGSLGTGIVKNTTTTGVLSIAVSGDFPTLNQNTTGSAATLTTARNLWGQSFNGSAAVTGSLTSVGDITGGASSMTITAGTGNSRTLTLQSTTSGGTATNGLVIDASQHITLEGVTSTGATGTGKFVFDNAPTITGHPTVEGVTSTGSTGTGKFVFDTSPTLATASLGSSTATTQSAGDNSTKVATTAYADAAGSGHAVYSGASPPTTDVGLFTIAKTGVNLKASGTTAIFTVPAGRTFICTGAYAVVTSVTGAGAGTETFQIKESGASGIMTGATVSGSATPAVGNWFTETPVAGSAPYTGCAAGNNVNIVVSTSQAGSTSVTGTVFVVGFYSS